MMMEFPRTLRPLLTMHLSIDFNALWNLTWSCQNILAMVPRLSKLAVGMLGVPASSPASERGHSVLRVTLFRKGVVN